MDEIERFDDEKMKNIKLLGKSSELKILGNKFIEKSSEYKYSYNFTWFGRPIIQYPQDIVAMQEIIWKVKPDLLIETGIAHGGSLIFYASLFEAIGHGEVLGIDVDIRDHNKKAIESHPLFKRIKMLQGSSTSDDIMKRVREVAKDKKCIMVCLDSSHTHEHVAKELELYAGFVTRDSYLVVFDTVIEELPADFFPNRPWGSGNNPKTAVQEFLKKNKKFVVDDEIDSKLIITVAPGGYLKRIS